MAKRGRPRKKISLEIGHDPTLERYMSLDAALKASVRDLAALIQSANSTGQSLPSAVESAPADSTDMNSSEHKKTDTS